MMSGAGQSPFLQFAFIGSLAIFVATRPSRIVLMVTAILGGALFVAHGGFSKLQAVPSQSMIPLLAFLGAGSLIVGGAVRASHFNREYVAMLALPALSVADLRRFCTSSERSDS